MLVNERPENRRNPEFDNEASLREARKKLPFELFLEQHGPAESCLFCQTQCSVKVITRPVVTGKISRATIEAVNAIEIVRVVEPRVPLKKNKACCPFHPEKSPGFNVVPRKNMFHCFGCPKSGGPVNFIREFEHVEFLPAVEHLAKEFGVPIVHATRGQETVFKCSNTSCTSGTWQEGDEWDEMDVLVGESQLAVWEGRKALTRTEAFMVFLKEAGVWKDRGRFKPNAPARGARALSNEERNIKPKKLSRLSQSLDEVQQQLDRITCTKTIREVAGEMARYESRPPPGLVKQASGIQSFQAQERKHFECETDNLMQMIQTKTPGIYPGTTPATFD